MNYIDLSGGYFDALENVKRNGGQLYLGNGKDSAVVVVQGKNCFTYWRQDSKRLQEVKALSETFDIDSHGKTGGRIARWLLKNIIELPFEKTFWQKNYRNLAKTGSHWHYMHVQNYTPFIGCEFDLKSAYFSSLFSGKSLLYQNELGWIDDRGALERLKEINYLLPKWFRLQLLGCLASWRMFFYVRNKLEPESNLLLLKNRYFIGYNAAFNAVHRAILRNYKIMEKIHKIGGKYIKRMHTDSFTLDVNCPEKIETEIFDYLENKSLEVDVKNCGNAFFFDVNTGFIGRNFVGSKNDVLDLMRKNELKMKRTLIAPEVQNRFGDKLKDSAFIKKIETSQNNENIEGTQLELFCDNP